MNLQMLEKLTHYDHSQKVAQISGIIAQSAGYSGKEVNIIEQAALLHDVGKNLIPEVILQKQSALTPEEYAIVKRHTTLGHRQIDDVAQILKAAKIVTETHHERPDGKGYLGLAGNEIHQYSRIVAVADVFDAIFSARCYKPSWAITDVLAYMEQNAGTQFDREYVSLLLERIENVLEIY